MFTFSLTFCAPSINEIYHYQKPFVFYYISLLTLIYFNIYKSLGATASVFILIFLLTFKP
jgi:hypothetical protein